MTAFAGSLGVEGTFMFRISPLFSFSATKSVNVPPMSMLTRYFTNCQQTTQKFHVFKYLRISSKAADGTGKSLIVSKPAGALITFGIALTTIATVPISPCTHG